MKKYQAGGQNKRTVSTNVNAAKNLVARNVNAAKNLAARNVKSAVKPVVKEVKKDVKSVAKAGANAVKAVGKNYGAKNFAMDAIVPGAGLLSIAAAKALKNRGKKK